jgi:hypothetical protein
VAVTEQFCAAIKTPMSMTAAIAVAVSLGQNLFWKDIGETGR